MNQLTPFIIKEGSRMTLLNNGHLKVYMVTKDFDVVEHLEIAGLKADDVNGDSPAAQIARESLQAHLIENGFIRLLGTETNKPH